MKKLINKTEKITGIIEEDTDVGYYLYIYDNSTNKCIADHLQETLEDAKSQGEEDYRLRLDFWKSEWRGLGDKGFPEQRVRGPEENPDRPFGKEPHGHVGPVNHIPIKPGN